jgi:hypothetical protein
MIPLVMGKCFTRLRTSTRFSLIRSPPRG